MQIQDGEQNNLHTRDRKGNIYVLHMATKQLFT